MVLPLLFSLGLPALAGTGALGATMAGLSIPALAGMGAGLGSFVQTGDLGKGIQTGMASFLGGKVLGGLSGSTSANAISAGTQGAAEAAKPGFLSGITSPSPAVSTIASGTPSNLATNFLGTEAAGTAMPFGSTPGATKGGAFTAAQQGFFPGMIGQTMTDAQLMQQEYENRAAKKDDDSTVPMPNPMRRTYNPNPYAGGGGEGTYFQYARPPRADGSQVQAPYYYADGGIMSLQEGGEMEADQMMAQNGMNEKDVIVSAIEAIKGMSEQPEIVLALFVQKYGEDALRDLVGRVQSGELDDTVDRFESGDKGMVRGPGDGSGVDDMVPATLEGEQDVLLSDGEFVLREKTTDALEKAYGGGFLDVVNRAEEDAPKKLQQMVG
tara:strand:+ start:422 stop:1567 length:1146 start_codon:yes stop_codon:yes gene_type:complete